MGKADELRYFFKTSLNAPTSIGHRTGDADDGEELGDLLVSSEMSVEDKLIRDEERAGKIRFLKSMLSFLKKTLSPEEFKFIKYRLTTKKKDVQIAVWLGYPSPSIVLRSIREKLTEQEEKVKKLCEDSAWEGAQAFFNSLTMTVKELSKEEETVQTLQRTNASYHAILEAAEKISVAKEEEGRAKIKRRFYMRGFYYGAKFKEELRLEEEIAKRGKTFFGLLFVLSTR